MTEDIEWLDGQIENQQYLIERGRGSHLTLAFLLEMRREAWAEVRRAQR